MISQDTNIPTPPCDKSITGQTHQADKVDALLQNKSELTVRQQGGDVCIILHNRGKGNALSVALAQQLRALYELMTQDVTISTITLTAEGKYFCTGMDLAEQLTIDPEVRFEAFHGLFRAIDRSPKTTIAAINGPAFGGGVALAFSCDVRIMVADAFMRLPEVKLGLCPAVATEYVVREWGVNLARVAMLSACDVSAHRLYGVGAVHELVDTPELLHGVVHQWQKRLGAAVPQATAWCKEIVTAQWCGGNEGHRDRTASHIFTAMMEQTSKSGARFAKFQDKKGVGNSQGTLRNLVP